MDIRKELQHIAEYQNSLLPGRERKKAGEITELVESTQTAFVEGKLNFKGYTRFQLNQEGKSRVIRMYEPFTAEELVSIYLKRLLDRRLHISYPNRNTDIKALFNTMYAVKDMSDYTIFKYDFMDFFNSVSSVYVYQKYIRGAGLERFQDDLLEQYVRDTQYAYAGLSTSNIICEIAARRFDDLLRQSAMDKGLIFYRRYIDDGILIFNRYMSEKDCLRLVRDTIDRAFYDEMPDDVPRCSTALNSSKTRYIARREFTDKKQVATFDYLGYQFELRVKDNGKSKFAKTEIRYGITSQKILKYSKRVERIVRKYAESPEKDMELLRHRIKAFTHRTVYRVGRHEGDIWKSKGFLSNYSELRYHMKELTRETETFLKRAVQKAFYTNGVKMPYFMRGAEGESIYSLYNNMSKYRTLLFVEMIGIDYLTLSKMCKQIGIDTASDKEYDSLVREYLIRVGVGH